MKLNDVLTPTLRQVKTALQEQSSIMTILLSVFIILLTASGQVFLKKGASHKAQPILNRNIVFGYSTYILVILLSITLMNNLPLKYFALIVSFSYPTTIIFARIFLKETITLKTLFACTLIVIGGIVFNL